MFIQYEMSTDWIEMAAWASKYSHALQWVFSHNRIIAVSENKVSLEIAIIDNVLLFSI